MWSPPTAQPPMTKPDHLSDAPSRQIFTTGYWCTDFIFEYENHGSHLISENQWMLPRRWRMAGAFKCTFTGDVQPRVPICARRSRDGNLAVFVTADYPIEKIEIPTAYKAIRHALAVEGLLIESEVESRWIRPPSKVAWTHPSNEARYLTGVFGMAGGLQRAKQFFLHPFLRGIFSKLGGTPSLAKDQVTPTANRLWKIYKGKPVFDLKGENERVALADLIVKAARSLKRPKDFVSYDELRELWKTYREEFWIRNPQQGTDDSVDWEKYEENSLDDCLIAMRHRQIIYQGHRWTCPKCHHRNWHDLGALSSSLSCEVCTLSQQAPVNIKWLFRPNEFLIESFRDHSVLSLIWTLSTLCDRARKSFIYVEPTWFGYAIESEKKDAEADLLVVIDGQAILCEVKSSWHSLRLKDISDFVALAIRLRPDTALLAIMEIGVGPKEYLTIARKQLEDEDIVFELLTPNEYEANDEPYLRF